MTNKEKIEEIEKQISALTDERRRYVLLDLLERHNAQEKLQITLHGGRCYLEDMLNRVEINNADEVRKRLVDLLKESCK